MGFDCVVTPMARKGVDPGKRRFRPTSASFRTKIFLRRSDKEKRKRKREKKMEMERRRIRGEQEKEEEEEGKRRRRERKKV